MSLQELNKSGGGWFVEIIGIDQKHIRADTFCICNYLNILYKKIGNLIACGNLHKLWKTPSLNFSCGQKAKYPEWNKALPSLSGHKGGRTDFVCGVVRLPNNPSFTAIIGKLLQATWNQWVYTAFYKYLSVSLFFFFPLQTFMNDQFLWLWMHWWHHCWLSQGKPLDSPFEKQLL